MATSKREEERNEKIIRGLMKLPPNRRCINCNSLGPQYVCTNFWTFVCMICSGIHREFTHRVKSVSMSKFTSQEVEALQNGGNQRAREIFLKDWDLQRQRVPNSSNADKVREFIKAVYVDRKYAGGNNSEKPPRDMQSHNSGDDIRRASSYHSYSQSPPYEFQYEERVKRTQGGPHGRKSGFDRGIYERKAASFIYSPGRFSDHIYEDRFTNAGSSSRVSDYSVSSGGDPFTPGPQSPNLQNDDGLYNPNIDPGKELDDASQLPNKSLNPEANAKRDANTIPVPHPLRSVSAGCIGLLDSRSTSLQGGFDPFSEPNQSSASTQNELSLFPSISQPPTEHFTGLNLFEETFGMPTSYSAPDVSFSQAPVSGTSPSINLFQPLSDSSALSPKFQNHQTSVSPSFSNSHELSNKSLAANINQKLSETSEPCDEGWATFDLPQASASIATTQSAFVSTVHSEGGASFTNTNSVLTSKAGMEWANFEALETPSKVSNPWNEGVQNAHAHTDVLSDQPWKAFEDYNQQYHSEKKEQGAGPQVSPPMPSSATNKDLDLENPEGFIVDGFQKVVYSEGVSFPSLVSHVAGGSSFSPPVVPLMGEIAQAGQKPGNPFDIDSELEANNAFLGVSTLQAVLPSMSPPSYDESWFPSNPVAYQGGLSYMPVQAPSSQLPNIQAPGAVASSSGNPFA